MLTYFEKTFLRCQKSVSFGATRERVLWMEPEVKATKSGTEEVPPAVHSSEPSLVLWGSCVHRIKVSAYCIISNGHA